jgi:transcription initiation factor TFIIB
VEKTAYIYRRAQERGLVRGRTMRAVLGAAIYIVQREMGISGTLSDIIAATNTKEKDLARAYRILLRELDLKVPMLDPAKCVSRVAGRASISERTKRKAMDMIFDVVERACSRQGPDGACRVCIVSCVHQQRRAKKPGGHSRRRRRVRSDIKEEPAHDSAGGIKELIFALS